MPPPPPHPLRIVLSGPESAGKSTLATALATHFGIPHASEYARVHLESHPSPRTAGELVEIARQHREWQMHHVPPAAPLGIHDTGMLNFLIWADVAFGDVPDAIERWLAEERHHLHLLCAPDLPWVADPLRGFPAVADRLALFERHQRALEARGTPFAIIRGDDAASRTGQARKIIEDHWLTRRQAP